MLELKHGTHARFVKCKKRAREALYWPEMSAPIEEIVIDRITCHDYAPAEQKNSKSCPRSTLEKKLRQTYWPSKETNTWYKLAITQRTLR